MKKQIVKKSVSLCLAAALMLSMVPATAFAAKGEVPEVNQEGITIDGNFEDWEGVPKTVITWDNQNSGTRVDHIGALYREDNTLYVLFREDAEYKYYDNNKKVLNVKDMAIDVGIKTSDKTLKVLRVDKEGKPIAAWEEMPDRDNGIYNDFGVFVFENGGGLKQVGSLVAYRVDKEEDGHRKNGDQIEFALDLEKLAEYWKGDVKDIKTIKVKNNWLGDKMMVITGSSSYALVFLLIGVCIACAGYVLYEKKKKKGTGDVA